MTPWWRGAVLYQVYVRSFCDADGDGHGDLPGLLSRLDYIERLGVDGIWLSPIHPSPNRDWGYDVADYDGVQADYGTLADFEALRAACHARGLKLVLDEVLAHTSDEHPWFTESRDGGAAGPKADWYVWAAPKADGTAPNNWLSVFGGPAWAYQPARRQHYHHKFLRQQPKLNWRNPGAREAALAVLDLWLGRGADGFRLDVAGAYLHDASLADNPAVPPAERTAHHWAHASEMQRHVHDANLPENIEVLAQVRGRVEAHGDRFVFGEFSEEEERCGAYLAPDEGLHSAYTFVLLRARELAPAAFRAHLQTLARFPGHWPTVSFSNHDVERTASRFGGPQAPPAVARLMLALLLAMRGTAIIYQGEELGLGDARLARRQMRDPVGDLYWPLVRARDGCRTPMPWRADAPHLGFSTGTPWLPLAPEHEALAVDRQEADPASTLAFTRALVALRKAEPTLTLGELIPWEPPGPLLAFERRLGEETILCAFNLGAAPGTLADPRLADAAMLDVHTGDASLVADALTLGPYAARFVRLAHTRSTPLSPRRGGGRETAGRR
jgi:alpha-glucosidase